MILYILQRVKASLKHGLEAPITQHYRLCPTPCQLLFGRVMIHNIALKANWGHIQKENRAYFLIH